MNEIEKKEAIENIARLIVFNLARHYTIQELARQATMNERMLKSGFQERYGMGVYAYLKNERLKKAKEQLELTNKPVLQIAMLVGFKSISAFSYAFRKKYQHTPRNYRKKGMEFAKTG